MGNRVSALAPAQVRTRQIDASNLDPASRSFFKFAFSNFFEPEVLLDDAMADVRASGGGSKSLDKTQVDRSKEERAAEFAAKLRPKRNRRRFAGDQLSFAGRTTFDLPRSRYHALMTPNGRTIAFSVQS